MLYMLLSAGKVMDHIDDLRSASMKPHVCRRQFQSSRGQQRAVVNVLHTMNKKTTEKSYRFLVAYGAGRAVARNGCTRAPPGPEHLRCVGKDSLRFQPNRSG